MKFVIQRVNYGVCTVNGKVTGQIDKGLVVLIGISNEDTKEVCDKMIKKLISLRIFEDEKGKTNLDIKSVNGELLLISQFTLYADCKKGNRPSFINAGDPTLAKKLYDYILDEAAKEVGVQRGEFGENMQISIVNDGPFTIVLDSKEL